MRRNRQVIRIVSLTLGLLRGDRLTVPALAAKHAVRRETIYRDLRALEDLEFPITGDIHGYKSRPRLREGYHTTVRLRRTLRTITTVVFTSYGNRCLVST